MSKELVLKPREIRSLIKERLKTAISEQKEKDRAAREEAKAAKEAEEAKAAREAAKITHAEAEEVVAGGANLSDEQHPEVIIEVNHDVHKIICDLWPGLSYEETSQLFCLKFLLKEGLINQDQFDKCVKYG